MSDDAITSGVCDFDLLRSGNWDQDCQAALSDWIKTGDFEEKRLKASRLIPYLIEHFLGSQVSVEGRTRGRRLAESLAHLEDILIATRSGIGRKFYRDHLNHLVRVALLANAIASKQSSFAGSQSKISHLILACLFHDIAYPLAESRTIIGQAIEAMESCYKTLAFPQFDFSYAMGKDTNLITELHNKGFKTYGLRELLNTFAHSIVGGIEFVDYVSDCKDFVDVMEAIIYHDSKLGNEVTVDRSPLLALLIIADEFQDWGRPVALQEEALISELGNLEISETVVRGQLDYRRESSLSPFRQVSGKMLNLRRLNLSAWKLNVNLHMLLPTYDAIDLQDLEECLTKLWDRKYERIVDLPLDEGRLLFMQSYYGTRVSQETHSSIIRALSEGTLAESSPTRQFAAYINSPRTELVLVEESIGCLEAINLKSKDGGQFAITVESQEEIPVKFHSIGDDLWRSIAEFLVGELRAFNRIVAACNQNERGERFLPSLGDYFSPPKLIRNRLRSAGLSDDEYGFVEKLRDIRKAISGGGLFIVERYES